MKLPKFIKSTQQSANKKKFIGGDQLLLTESTYSIMSNNHKFFTPQKRVAFVINDYKYINDKYNIRTPAPEQAPSTPFNQDSSFTNLFQIKTPMNPTSKMNFIDSVVSSPRYTKSSAKRLQRNRLQHVRAKPTNYVLRSTVLLQQKQTDCCDGFVTPIKPIVVESLLNDSIKKATVTNNQQNAVEHVQQNSNSKRFSLTKLVSQSALKVLSCDKKEKRNSYGSNCSSLSSISFQTDDGNDTIDDEIEPKKCNINLEKLLDGTTSPAQLKQRRVPNMGVSSKMLRNLKRNGQSTANYVPNMYLVGMPIVFKSSDLSVEIKLRPIQANNYDRLDRALIQKQQTPKKAAASPAYLRHQTTCRISVFNGHTKVNQQRKHYSSSQLNESQTYDSIIF